MKIGIKLSMMGIGLTSVTPMEISEIEMAKGETVEKYIDLLEKAYIIFRLPAFFAIIYLSCLQN